jgi:hypothetical protein
VHREKEKDGTKARQEMKRKHRYSHASKAPTQWAEGDLENSIHLRNSPPGCTWAHDACLQRYSQIF